MWEQFLTVQVEAIQSVSKLQHGFFRTATSSNPANSQLQSQGPSSERS